MIELKDIHKTYRATKIGVRALQGVSLKIDSGEFIAIMGPSGSGKSTLLHILGLLGRADSGLYTLFGREVHTLGDDELAILRKVVAGFVFQQSHLLPGMTALENVELPLIYAGKGRSGEKARQRIADVGLSQRIYHRSNELSGGEQQRVAIARALMNEPLMILADEPTGNLDTKSAEGIISILRRLNQNGKTIIMVTHEKDIARCAKRIISMRDGFIVSDKKNASESVVARPEPSADISFDRILSERRSGAKRIKFKDFIRQATQAILAHKLRSLLSMLGILIGVSAVIAMLAIIEGAREDIRRELSALGSNVLIVVPGAPRHRGIAYEAGSVRRLTLRDAAAIAKLPYVSEASAAVRGRAQVVYGNKNWNTTILGVEEEHKKIVSEIPIAGRFFTESDVQSRKKVALLGLTVLKELFGDKNPVGATIKINRINFRVIGVLSEKGAAGWRDRDDNVIVPVTTAMYRLLGRKYAGWINISIKDSSLMDDAGKQIVDLLAKRHHVREDPENSFSVYNMQDVQETYESTIRTMSLVFAFIAAVSLLVGGIGIMNIMLVSVTERTREIGLRKAVGARAKEIMAQFLVESVVMAITGGILGIIFGIGIAVFFAKIAGWLARVSLFSILLATTSSVAVGLVFGLWPAHQAAKLDPIEALRYE